MRRIPSRGIGGYVVEGCGYRDQYVCVDCVCGCNDDSLLADMMFGRDRCVL